MHRLEISKTLPLSGFKWVENTSQVNKAFIEKYNKDSDENYFLEVDVQYSDKLHECILIYPFCQKELKLKKL